MNKLLLVALSATGAIAHNNLVPRQLREATCQDVIDARLQGYTCCADGTTPCAPGSYCSLGESDTEWACCPNGVVCGNEINNGGTITNTNTIDVTATQVETVSTSTEVVESPADTTSVVEPPKDTTTAVVEPPKYTSSAAPHAPTSTESAVYVPPASTYVPVPTPGSNGTKPDTTPIPTVVNAGSTSGVNVLGGLLAGLVALLV